MTWLVSVFQKEISNRKTYSSVNSRLGHIDRIVLCCERAMGSINLSIANKAFIQTANRDPFFGQLGREWLMFRKQDFVIFFFNFLIFPRPTDEDSVLCMCLFTLHVYYSFYMQKSVISSLFSVLSTYCASLADGFPYMYNKIMIP